MFSIHANFMDWLVENGYGQRVTAFIDELKELRAQYNRGAKLRALSEEELRNTLAAVSQELERRKSR